MSLIPVDLISNWILKTVNKPISPRKLQQLLYYCQAWYVAKNVNSLFGEDIIAWARGPVVVSQFERFRKTAPDADINIDVKNLKMPKLEIDTAILLRNVLNRYEDCTTMQLELRINKEYPIRHARAGLKIFQPSDEVVSLALMHSYYSKHFI